VAATQRESVILVFTAPPPPLFPIPRTRPPPLEQHLDEANKRADFPVYLLFVLSKGASIGAPVHIRQVLVRPCAAPHWLCAARSLTPAPSLPYRWCSCPRARARAGGESAAILTVRWLPVFYFAPSVAAAAAAAASAASAVRAAYQLAGLVARSNLEHALETLPAPMVHLSQLLVLGGLVDSEADIRATAKNVVCTIARTRTALEGWLDLFPFLIRMLQCAENPCVLLWTCLCVWHIPPFVPCSCSLVCFSAVVVPVHSQGQGGGPRAARRRRSVHSSWSAYERRRCCVLLCRAVRCRQADCGHRPGHGGQPV
jgi:hypothetical protein